MLKNNFWNQLENKEISKEQVEEQLLNLLGKPNNQTQNNLFQEFCKKVNNYYFTTEFKNLTIYSLIGEVEKADNILEKKFKEGRRIGQTYYVLKINSLEGVEKLQALQEDLEPANFNQIQELAILGQKLVFKYKKWITNKQIIDFYPAPK